MILNCFNYIYVPVWVYCAPWYLYVILPLHVGADVSFDLSCFIQLGTMTFIVKRTFDNC